MRDWSKNGAIYTRKGNGFTLFIREEDSEWYVTTDIHHSLSSLSYMSKEDAFDKANIAFDELSDCMSKITNILARVL